MRRFHPHTDSVSCVKFTPDGNRIITCSLDGTFKVIELGGSEVFSVDLKEKLRYEKRCEK